MDNKDELLKKIDEKIDDAIRILREIKALVSGRLGENTPPKWLIPRIFVWYEIYIRGGAIDRSELRKIGRMYGYDPRGLGGFFAGDEPSLRYTGKEKDKIVLERWAEKYVEDYLDWIEKNIDDYRKTINSSATEKQEM